MNKLTPELQKIVENATLLSLEQRAMIQHHWQSQKELPEVPKTVGIIYRLLLPLIIPGIITVLALSMFSEQWGPAMSRASGPLLVFLWLVVVVFLPVVMLISHLHVCTLRTKEDEKRKLLLNPIFIVNLRKKNKLRDFYNIALNITLVVMVAMSGSLITAFFITLSVILCYLFTGAQKLALLKTVKEETAAYLLGDGSVRALDV